MTRRGSSLLYGLTLAVASIRLVWIWAGRLDGEITLADDAFYYFQIARHVALGHGLTFDGLAPTNGFHPLYLGILSGLYKILPSTPWLPIHIAQTMLLISDITSAWLLYRIAFHWGTRCAVIASILWLTNPMAIATSHRAMESSLSTLLVLAAAYVYSRWLHDQHESRAGIRLGVLLGLAILARTENVLFAIALLAHALLVQPRATYRSFLPVILLLFTLLTPWIAWQWSTFGTIEQSSGAATRLFRIYGHLDANGLSRWHPALAWKRLDEVFEWVHRCALAQEFQPLRAFGRVYLGSNALLSSIVVAALGYSALRKPVRYRMAILGPLLIYGILHFLYYYWIANTYRPWYHLSIVAILSLGGAVLMDQLRWRRAMTLGVAGWVILHLSVFGLYLYRSARFETSRTAETRIRWLEQHCGSQSRIGLMNAGKLGYLAGFRSQLTIINLDGVVNNVLLRACRERRFAEYFCRNVDCALEIPAPSVFRDPVMREAFERFRRETIIEMPTQPVPLFRFRCPSATDAPGGAAPRDSR